MDLEIDFRTEAVGEDDLGTGGSESVGHSGRFSGPGAKKKHLIFGHFEALIGYIGWLVSLFCVLNKFKPHKLLSIVDL